MKKPDSLPRMLGTPVIILGFFVIASAYFRSPATEEVAKNGLINTNMILPAVGFFCVLAGIALVLFGQEYEIRRRRARHRGAQVQGQVTDIKTLRYIRFGRVHPTVVYYSYSYEDTSFEGKSEFLWEDPQMRVGSRVTICVDGYKPKRSAIAMPGSAASKRAEAAAAGPVEVEEGVES